MFTLVLNFEVSTNTNSDTTFLNVFNDLFTGKDIKSGFTDPTEGFHYVNFNSKKEARSAKRKLEEALIEAKMFNWVADIQEVEETREDDYEEV